MKVKITFENGEMKNFPKVFKIEDTGSGILLEMLTPTSDIYVDLPIKEIIVTT
jgi:hypothetical protein